ncbi:MAG: amidase family protein, partial [Minisyncoccia bacterium]
GRDPLDSTTHDTSRQSLALPRRVGVPRHLFSEGVDADVLEVFEKSLDALREQGLEIVDLSLPSMAQAIATYYIINFAEVSSNLARFDGVRYGFSLKGNTVWEDFAKTRAEGFGAEVRRRIMLGTYVLSAGYYDAYYGTATEARARLAQEFADAFKQVDVIATPTAPTPAFKLGEKSDPLSMYLADLFTVPANLAGLPAVSVPGGVVAREGNSLPVGIQFVAAKGAEETLFATGKMIEN